MKVLFSTNVPSPYRVNFFNELGKECDLTVLFEKGTSSERDKSWMDYKFENFAGIIMKGFSIKPDSALCLGFKKYIKKIKPDIIVICNFASPTGVLLARYCRKNNLKYYIESDGGFGVTKQKGFNIRLRKKYLKIQLGVFQHQKRMINIIYLKVQKKSKLSDIILHQFMRTTLLKKNPQITIVL